MTPKAQNADPRSFNLALDKYAQKHAGTSSRLMDEARNSSIWGNERSTAPLM